MQRKKRSWGGVAALCVLPLVLSSCAPLQAAPEPPEHPDVFVDATPTSTISDGGEIVMALSAEPDKLDPTTSSSLYTRFVMQPMCEKLYDINEAGEVVPLLAESMPVTSADGKTVTLSVRSGITFADGTPLNAEAVKTTLMRNLELKGSSRKSELGPITGISVDGPNRVVVSFEAPFAPFQAALADRAGMIMSPAALEKSGDAFAQSPVCVGPFKFEKRVPQTSISLVRDPEYYDQSKIHADRITYRIMTDANIRAANIRSGDVQVADAMSPQDIDALQREKSVGTLQALSLGYQGLTINVGNVKGVGEAPGEIKTPLASDPRVRLALSLAVDRKTLVNTVFNGWYAPACSPIAPASPFASEASEACPGFDPERAKELLTEAGVKTPYKISMKISNTQDGLRFAQALQASVKEAGFDLQVVPVEYSSLLDDQLRGDFELLALGWSGRIDPHGNMASFLKTGAGNNYAGYSSPIVDDLLNKGSQTIDPAERATLYGQAVTQIQKDNPLIYLYRQRTLTAFSRDVAGVKTYSDGVVRLSEVGFVKGGR